MTGGDDLTLLKLLHQIATTVTPFSYPSYANDIAALSRVHPVALYRRLAEPNVTRKKPSVQSRAWLDCMDKWTEELGAREKTQVTFPAMRRVRS